jgi:hypothetical protein
VTQARKALGSTLKRLKVTQARKALGSRSQTSDGEKINNVKFFRDKTAFWADHVCSGHLQPDDAWQALKFMILKGIEYPLMSTCLLTTQQYQHIMSPAQMAGTTSIFQPSLWPTIGTRAGRCFYSYNTNTGTYISMPTTHALRHTYWSASLQQ